MEIPYTVHPRPDTQLWNAKVGIWLFLASEVMLFGGLFSGYIFLRLGATEAVQWPHGLLNVPVGTFNTAVLIVSSVTMVMAWAAVKLRQFAQYRLYLGITILCGMIFMGVKSYEYNEKFHHFGVVLKDNRQITGHLEKETPDAYVIHPDRYVSHGAAYGPPEKHLAPAGAEKTGGAHGHAAPQAKGEARAGHSDHGAEAGHEAVTIAKAEVRRAGYFLPGYSPYFAIYFTLTGLHALHVLGGMVVNIYLWGPGAAMYRTDPEHLANRVEVSGLFWHFVDLVWIFLFPILYLL